MKFRNMILGMFVVIFMAVGSAWAGDKINGSSLLGVELSGLMWRHSGVIHGGKRFVVKYIEFYLYKIYS